MRLLAMLALLCAAPISVQAGAQPAPGSEGLCTGFEETHEGVWLGPSGAEVLRFRYGFNADGAGCYAWLNPVPDWKIAAAGATVDSRFSADGALRIWRDPGGGEGVRLNLDTGEAAFVFNGRTTPGRLND